MGQWHNNRGPVLLQVLWVLKETFVGIELPCVHSIGVSTITKIPERCAMCLLTHGGFLHGMLITAEVDFNVLELWCISGQWQLSVTMMMCHWCALIPNVKARTVWDDMPLVCIDWFPLSSLQGRLHSSQFFKYSVGQCEVEKRSPDDEQFTICKYLRLDCRVRFVQCTWS